MVFRQTKLPALFFCIFLSVNPVLAQQPTEKTVPGEYLLEGVMETAAGFLIRNDHTFAYFFVYGAADKAGSGTWQLRGNKLLLNSGKTQPPSDFILVSSTAKRGKGILVRITDAKGNKYPYVKCRLADLEDTETETDEKGEAHLETIGSGKLELYHPIFSTRLSTLSLNPNHSEFTIYPAYNLAEIFFTDFELQILPNRLRANNLPGMPPQRPAEQNKPFDFVKQE